MRIYLTTNKDSWFDVVSLPEGLAQQARERFNEISSLSEGFEDEVIIFNKATQEYENKKIFRQYKSFLTVPGFDPNTKKSYMFSGSRESTTSASVPSILEPFCSYLKAIDPAYNQLVVNYYQDGAAYIEPHSDCTAKLLPQSDIAIITVNEGETERELTITARTEGSILQSPLKIRLCNNLMFIMGGDFQKNFRHGIESDISHQDRRLSFTFRKVA